MRTTSTLILLLLATIALAAACAPKTGANDPHEPQIAALAEENAKLKREIDALKARYEAPAATPAPPIETRCAKAGDRWKLTPSGRAELVGNTAGVRRDLHPTPVFGDGKFVGYRVHTMEPTGIGISCGLENGDVVLKVNGLVPSIRMEAELMTAKRVEIEILRGDKPRTLVIEISS